MTTVQETGGPRHRADDPLTSQLAAEAASVADSRLAVLRTLAARPLTDEEIAADWFRTALAEGLPTYSGSSRLRTARKELVELGLVALSAHVGRTSSGRACSVWAITILGLEALGS